MTALHDATMIHLPITHGLRGLPSVLVSWRLMQVLRGACWACERAGTRKSGGTGERVCAQEIEAGCEQGRRKRGEDALARTMRCARSNHPRWTACAWGHGDTQACTRS